MALNELSKGFLAADQIRKKMNANSPKKLSSSSFHVAIRNPVYYGKIFIEKHKEEEAHFVTGQHEPLITKELFDKVQTVLDGKRRLERPNTKILSDALLPLRGFWYAQTVPVHLQEVHQKEEETDITITTACPPADFAKEQKKQTNCLKNVWII